MTHRYDSSEIPFSAEEIASLSHKANCSAVFLMEIVHKLMRKESGDQEEPASFIWGWVAATAYRAGRLSMWKDCRHHCAVMTERKKRRYIYQAAIQDISKRLPDKPLKIVYRLSKYLLCHEK